MGSDVKVTFIITDMHDREVEFIKKMQAILDFIQCQLKLFTNLHITYLKYNILSFILT